VRVSTVFMRVTANLVAWQRPLPNRPVALSHPCRRSDQGWLIRSPHRPVDDRLLAALIQDDGGAVRVKCVREECEVEHSPEQRAAQGQHSLDDGTR